MPSPPAEFGRPVPLPKAKIGKPKGVFALENRAAATMANKRLENDRAFYDALRADRDGVAPEEPGPEPFKFPWED